MASYDYLIETGVIVPDTANTRTEVEDEFKDIFGADFVTDAETPEGQWIDAETTSRQSVARNNAAVANQINPNLAGGPFLDALWALTGGQRKLGRPSLVATTITGLAGTVIPAGSRSRTTGGDEFQAVNAITIPAGGTIEDQEFESVSVGPIEALPDTLTIIVDSVLGWETINNPNIAVLGVSVESDQASRLRRRMELGLQGRSTPEAVIANVSNVDGVRSLSFLENMKSTTETIEGITLVAHSIWTAIQGGNNEAIAEALLKSKTAGTAYNGSVSVTVTEPYSHQNYTVKFDRPEIINILVRVTIKRGGTTSNPTAAIQNSVLRYARGEMIDEIGFVVGSDVSPFEISGAINRDIPNLFLVKTEVAIKGSSPIYTTNTIAIDINQLAEIAYQADIQVIIES